MLYIRAGVTNDKKCHKLKVVSLNTERKTFVYQLWEATVSKTWSENLVADVL